MKNLAYFSFVVVLSAVVVSVFLNRSGCRQDPEQQTDKRLWMLQGLVVRIFFDSECKLAESVRNEELEITAAFDAQVASLLKQGRLDTFPDWYGDGDGWHKPFKLFAKKTGDDVEVRILSSGGDQQAGTKDDKINVFRVPLLK